ncbi:major capsid protein P2 [Vibrio rotiferianus]|uniref:major capsid protein P2 n=1 Tax=Vibrio rotiferianus TaxID=190895 RepID=UPI0005EF6F34|nr:major capsid protein P2 [Vibrio rotiferianus]
MQAPMKLNAFTGIGYGQKSTVVLPVGPTYEEIHLRTNLSAGMIKRVSISLNAEEIYILTGAQLLMLEAYKKQPAKTGYFTIPFADIVGKTKNGIRATGLVTEVGDNIILEVEVGSPSDLSSAPAIDLSAWAVVSEPQMARVLTPKIRPETMQATSGGENEFLNLNSGATKLIRRMHFISDKVTDLKIERDFKKVFECDKDYAEYLAGRHERAPQNGYFHFDPIQRGFFLQDLFKTAHSSQLKFTVTTTQPIGSLPILVESVEVERPDLLQGLL